MDADIGLATRRGCQVSMKPREEKVKSTIRLSCDPGASGDYEGMYS